VLKLRGFIPREVKVVCGGLVDSELHKLGASELENLTVSVISGCVISAELEL